MKSILKLEELTMWLLSGYGLYYLQSPWWCYVLLLLGPDISMLAYTAGNKTGAAVYNIFHHRGIAIAVMAAGWFIASTPLSIAGVILFGHAAMDRFFGYGLKYDRGFKYTHLGTIGNKE